MSDSQFLRQLAEDIESLPDELAFHKDYGVTLRRIALDLERPRTDVLFREANNSEARIMRSYVAGFAAAPTYPVGNEASFGEEILRSTSDESILELTPEMEIPPGPHSELDVFMQTYNRDLVAEVRQELRNAMDNGYDQLQNMDNEDIAGDIRQCTTGYEEVSDELMCQAIQQVRLDPTGVYA